MPKVTGPLHSDHVHGAFAKQMIFQERHAQDSEGPLHQIVKAYKAPKEPNNAAQLLVQDFTKLLTQRWPTLTTEQQATWQALATARNYERINAFFVENWARHVAELEITDTWPPATGTCEVTAGDPAPNPDCTGTYERIADYDSEPCYRRTTDGAYYIFYSTYAGQWQIAATLAEIPDDWWWASEGPAGEYLPAEIGFTGNPIVSEPTG